MPEEQSPSARPVEVEVRAILPDHRRIHSPEPDGRPIELNVRSGEFVSIVGAAGCGKSTLVRMIAGLNPNPGGEIRIGGKRVAGPRADVGIVFEKPALMNWRSVLENVTLQPEIKGIGRGAARELARRTLARLGLEGQEEKMPGELSASMRVRAALARALIHGPSLLLMDDPFRELDPLCREQMMLDLQRLGLSPRVTVILTTTHILEAVQLSDRVLILSDGRILQDFAIDLPRPRRLDRAAMPHIMEYCGAIRTALQAQGILR